MSEIFKGAAKRIDDIDLPRIGSRIGVGEDVIHAFIEVETRGTGFDKQDRVIILFEPHIFYRLLSGAKRKQAVDAGLAYKSWGEQPYPRDSYPRLIKAIEIDETAALKACSWGMGQIMGSNHKMVGYDSVQDMVRAFADDEETHLEAIIAFAIASKIDDDLRRLEAKLKAGQAVTPADCIPVVSAYNGKGYARNQYHIRFAAAINRWRKIKDTPYAGSINLKQAAAVEEKRFDENPDAIIAEASGEEAKPGEPVAEVPAKSGEAIVGGRPEDPPKQVSQGGTITRVLAGVGGGTGILTAIGGFFKGNAGIIAIGIVCATLIFLTIMFRQVLLDWLRLKLNARPDQYNVR